MLLLLAAALLVLVFWVDLVGGCFFASVWSLGLKGSDVWRNNNPLNSK